MKKKSPDKPFLILSLALGFIGFLLFFSVALGTLNSTTNFLLLITKQFIALGIGVAVMLFLAYSPLVNYQKLKYHSLLIFVAMVVLQLLVFVPGIGVEINGAQRWISLGVTNIQPSELLKIATIVFLAALLAQYGKKMKRLSSLVIVCALSLGVVFFILFLAKDIGTILVIAIASFFVLAISETSNTKLFGLAGLGAGFLLLLIFFFRRYAWDRLLSFFGVTDDALGSDFQIDQSLYTIGSGEIFGRGFGQSLQKFAYLPEPLNDSIFAVIAEESGFIGSVILIMLFTAFILRGLSIARRAKDAFGTYIITGLVLLIGAQCFINIAAMLKLFPLSGMPLLFISHGGTALVATYICVGLILNVSRYAKK